MGVSGPAGLLKRFGRRARFTHPKVIGNGAVKEIGILIDHCDLRANVFKRQIFKVVPADANRALVRVIKAKQQTHD